MKFSHQLKFNSVPEWREFYVDYPHLKKFIFACARAEQDDIQQLHEVTLGPTDVRAPLLHTTVTLGHDKVRAWRTLAHAWGTRGPGPTLRVWG
jgi:hypothetical protein